MSHTLYPPARQRLQRSELAVPGSNPGMFEKAANSSADYDSKVPKGDPRVLLSAMSALFQQVELGGAVPRLNQVDLPCADRQQNCPNRPPFAKVYDSHLPT